MPPNQPTRCPGSTTEAGGLDALCTSCCWREWTPGVLYAVMKPAVRFTLRRGRYCINRKPAVAMGPAGANLEALHG